MTHARMTSVNETDQRMEGDNETAITEALCSNQFPFPKYLDPCAGGVFCTENFTSPFSDPCDGKFRIIAQGVSSFLIPCGIVMNSITFVVFGKMKMNEEFQFLMKSLAVYDSMTLFGTAFAFGPEYFRWILGFGYDRNTAYLYIERASYYGLYRLGGSMSFWTIAVLTVQK